MTVFPASYFDGGRPSTALDMINRLPGFTFSDTNQTIRGLDGSAGNVLVDGTRPSVKADALSEILKRIPASSVLRIELIHGGTAGIDMAGYTVLANVVHKTGAVTELSVRARVEFFSDGRSKPAVRVVAARRDGDDEISGSFYAYTDEADDNGSGTRIVRAPGGSLISSADARVRFPADGIHLQGGLQTDLVGGIFKSNVSLNLDTYRNVETDRFSALDANLFKTSDSARQAELSLEYNRALGRDTDLKTTFVQSIKVEPDISSALALGVPEVFTTKPQAIESIARANVGYAYSDTLSFEAGTEGAYNFLKTATQFVQGGVVVPLPNAEVAVSETRAEGFGSAVWRPESDLTLDASARWETSTITERGDTTRSEHFLFPKPRLLLTWSADTDDQFRLHLEREVGQLDFNEFAASANLAGGTVSAGNANLRPPRDWLTELSLEHRFWTDGSVLLDLSRADFTDIIDEIDVQGLTAPGNIGSGYREEATVTLSVPLERFGITNGLFSGNLLWRLASHVKDPVTGAVRFISGDKPVESAASITGDLPALKSVWTVGFVGGTTQSDFRVTEIDRTSYDSLVNLTWLYHPTSGLSVTLFCDYLPDRHREFVRTVSNGPRGTVPVAFTDDLSLTEGLWAAIDVREQF